MKKQITIREAREILYYSNKYAVIGADEYTNEDARRFLFDIENQDAYVNMLDMGDYICFWGV